MIPAKHGEKYFSLCDKITAKLNVMYSNYKWHIVQTTFGNKVLSKTSDLTLYHVCVKKTFRSGKGTSTDYTTV